MQVSPTSSDCSVSFWLSKKTHMRPNSLSMTASSPRAMAVQFLQQSGGIWVRAHRIRPGFRAQAASVGSVTLAGHPAHLQTRSTCSGWPFFLLFAPLPPSLWCLFGLVLVWFVSEAPGRAQLSVVLQFFPISFWATTSTKHAPRCGIWGIRRVAVSLSCNDSLGARESS